MLLYNLLNKAIALAKPVLNTKTFPTVTRGPMFHAKRLKSVCVCVCVCVCVKDSINHYYNPNII